MTQNASLESLQAALDQCQEWPCDYIFKFIVPSGQQEEVVELLQGFELSFRPSRKGNYVSVTARAVMNSSREVVGIYRAAQNIENIICL